MENKIGCSAGKLTIVDPNDRDGFDSSNNMSVPLEDLNISVILRTSRKARTVLSTTGESSSVESSSKISVNFIEGSETGAGKSLTTKYTDLTTVFDKGTLNSETLGITNIDISFNPSMAPMISIDFVDVRGSSIFQNEENISGNNSGNKYGVFFQLPYPLFELEIKGYYGKPVTYCLHMLKFNAKFNSKTGNFEIQCQFVGYTYAMLSDLIIGYMKAIPYTEIGKSIYAAINLKRTSKILDLNELMIAIGKINEGIPKISNNSDASKNLNSINEALKLIDEIKNNLNILGVALDVIPELARPEFTFIIKPNNKKPDIVNKAINDYTSMISLNIEKFNKLTTNIVTLKLIDFTDLTTIGIDKGLTVFETKKSLSGSETDDYLTGVIGSFDGMLQYKKNINNYLNKYYKNGLSDDLVFDAYNLTKIYKTLANSVNELKKTEKNTKMVLAEELKNSFSNNLSFEPTVKNITEIFTVAIEVMMETIYTVSNAAELNITRTEELAKKFTTDLVSSTDIKKNSINKNKFFAWPDYKEKEIDGNFVDKYLGDYGVLENPQLVDELNFIDDLLKAFIISQELTNQVETEIATIETTWFPVNPLDTKLFNEQEPYARTTYTTKEEVIRMIIHRGITFLGYTNGSNTLDVENKEIEVMAKIEVDAIVRNITNKTLLQSISQLSLEDYINVKIDKNDGFKNLLIKAENNYIYANPRAERRESIIPISDTFSGEWLISPDELKEKARWDNNANKATDSFFLTNYHGDGLSNKKPIDGSMYMKIIPVDSFKNNVKLFPTSDNIETESLFDLAKMSDDTVDSTAGYNSFGGSLGIQEYVKMDFGGSIGSKLPLMYVFYRNSASKGLSRSRKLSADKITPLKTKYDFDKESLMTTRSTPKEKEKFFLDNEDNVLHEDIGLNRELFNALINGDTSITFPYFEQPAFDTSFTTGFGTEEYRSSTDNHSFSLFGSKFYYGQSRAKIESQDGSIYFCGNYSKAFLFLNNLPWNTSDGSPFEVNEIKHLFNQKAGFIHSPRLWCAWVGSILWRLSSEDPIIEGGLLIGGGSGVSDGNRTNDNPKDPIFWSKNGETLWDVTFGGNHDRDELLQWLEWGLSLGKDYVNIDKDSLFRRLPIQVIEEFKNSFFSFVNGTDDKVSWNELKNELEIFSGNSTEFNSFLNTIKNAVNEKNDTISVVNYINDKFKSKNYVIMTPIGPPRNESNVSSRDNDYLALEMGGNYATNSGVKALIDAMKQEVIIVNNNYKIWRDETDSGNNRYINSVSVASFNIYLSALITEIKTQIDSFSPTLIKRKIEQQVFGTTDESVIKFILYTTCKNINDKWLAGATDPKNLIFQCGDSSSRSVRSKVDLELAKNNGRDTPSLIDSFRFVSRSFQDIGDKLFINPIPVNNYLIKSPNTSAYDAISGLLDSNKFVFNALPTFVNYKDPENLKAMFGTYPNYEEAIANGSCGPNFVCVYAGQPSKHLDFNNSEYGNDSFDFECNDGNVSTDAPNDFTTDISDGEDPVAVFKVAYGQQNQNIFKDILLDQSEFIETDESLQIQEDISQKGGQTNRSLAGQNIFNVYSVRSYKAQVEMMGNAMIQPMMYFQLDNIPMFHGAYMITGVKHNIKPNYMSTVFTGTRTRYSDTPLITAYDLFMSLTDSIDTENAGTGVIDGETGSFKTGSYAPIIQTIIENGSLNSIIESNNITLTKIDKIKYISFELDPDKRMLTEAAVPLTNMLTDWGKWMSENDFTPVSGSGDNAIHAYITSMYRVRPKQNSPHGWGIAVDLQMFRRNGSEGIFRNEFTTGSPAKFFNFEENPAIGWLYRNSYKYGFVQPYWANDGQGLGKVNGEEHWHWEYHGKSAICMLRNRPIPGAGGNKASDNPLSEIKEELIKPFVKNPKGKDGKEAVYIGCNYKTINASDRQNGIEGAIGCKSPKYDFKFQNPIPEPTLIGYNTTVNKIKLITSDIGLGKAVFAIMFAEASKNAERTSFKSAGGFNYSGVQTDGGKWGSPGITGQYCRVDSGGKTRAFAVFDDDDGFLKFMVDRVRSKGFNSDNANDWVTTYINRWWSPADKANFNLGTPTFNQKLAIYNSAIKRWDQFA